MRKSKKIWRAACGTPAGYNQHLRNHERPCKQCLVGSDTYSEEEIHGLLQDFHTWNREQQLWRTHRLSLARFTQILAEQKHLCACCGTPEPEGATWHIDHDPTGLIRGILCTRCNTGITQLGDDLESLQRAVAYLQAHEARGGHAKSESPPVQEDPSPSAVMQRCFELFQQDVPRHRIVVILQLPPATVEEIYDLWCKRGGEIKRVSRHVFQIARDLPQRVLCSCGYAVPWNDLDELEAAVDRVNAHIRETETDHEAEWQRLETEERERRYQEEQHKRAEQRRSIANELQSAR